MPDMKGRSIYARIALSNVMHRAEVYDPDNRLEVGEDGYTAPVHQGRIIPRPQTFNREQVLPYNRLQSENRDKVDKAIDVRQFAMEDYLGRVTY